jgi:hypothetical protein
MMFKKKDDTMTLYRIGILVAFCTVQTHAMEKRKLDIQELGVENETRASRCSTPSTLEKWGILGGCFGSLASLAIKVTDFGLSSSTTLNSETPADVCRAVWWPGNWYHLEDPQVCFLDFFRAGSTVALPLACCIAGTCIAKSQCTKKPATQIMEYAPVLNDDDN